MICRLIVAATVAFLFRIDPIPTTYAGEPPGFGTYVDVHMHYCNQWAKEWAQQYMRQNRIRPQPGQQVSIEFTDADYLACADNMIKTMDQHGIGKVVLMPQPRIAGQHGYYDYEKIVPAIRKYQDRLVLAAGGGILNSMIHKYEADEVTDVVKTRFRSEAEKIVSLGAKGFGEMASLHLSMNQQHVFEHAPADHPLFLLLADIAAENDMPIDIHMEAVVKDTPCPVNLKRASQKNPDVIPATVPALKRLLAHNPKAKIIWQHMGWDNTGQMTIALLRTMLADHPNLYLGFKIEEREDQVGNGGPMPNRMVDKDYKLKPEWIEFMSAYTDRIMVAVDEFIGIPGKTQRAPAYLKQTYGTITRQLPEAVLLKVARDNAIRIYNLK